jgi:hypothetical protein
MLSGDTNLILVDAHVHIRKHDKLDKYFEAAFNNFRKISKNYRNPQKIIGILCLTEEKNERLFQNLRELADGQGSADSSFLIKKSLYTTKEDISLKISSRQEEYIFLIAGRQIVSQENIEILALGSLNQFEDGSSIDKLITDISEQRAIPVIPWGFGKWLGGRGKIIKNVLHRKGESPLFIGDNGNRPNFWTEPAIFRLAEKMKIKNLAGSDPLPVPGDYRCPGRYGFALKGSLSTAQPWKDLKSKLLNPNTHFEYFGTLESPVPFIRNQFAMQYRKRFSSWKIQKQTV